MIQEYLNIGWRLVPLHEYKKDWDNPQIKYPKSSKAPFLNKGWQLKENTITSLDRLLPNQGVAIAHAYSGTMSLDIDNWVEADKLLKPHGVDLQSLYDAPDSVAISSGRENRGKLLFKMPFGAVLPTKKIPYTDNTNTNQIAYELRCGNSVNTTVQDVLPPSIHPDTAVPYTWAGNGHYSKLPTIPIPLLKVWQSLLVKKTVSVTITPTDANWNEIQQALNLISPDSTEPVWNEICDALHDEGFKSNHSDVAFNIFDSWSAKGKKYKGRDTTWAKWSRKKAGHGITIKTLFKYARENGYGQDASSLFSAVPVNTEATQPVTYKSLTRDMALDKSPWVNSWIFLACHDTYIDVNVMLPISTLAFNNMNNHHIPLGPKGGRQTASIYTNQHNLIENVYHNLYLPHIKETVTKINGIKVLNSFRPSSVPKAAESYTPAGHEAVQLIINHINYICHENKKYADILTQWIAHQVQHPGVLLRWCPVIQGKKGIGKSFFRDLLIQILGDENVGVVSSSQVTSDFNGWAVKSMVSTLEELRLRGHNRYDALNALNPLITDKKVHVNEKNVKAYYAKNVTNYICFTNWRDAIPIEKGSRRWWIMFAPEKQSSDNYYNMLFSAKNDHPLELRKYFLELKISKEFANLEEAPDTEFKQSMIRTEEANTEGLAEMEALINEGGMYFNKDYIASSYMFDHFKMTYSEILLTNKQKNLLMMKLGYGCLTNQMKITNGKVSKIWSKKTGKVNHVEIRASWKLTNPFIPVTPENSDSPIIKFKQHIV